MFLNNLLTSTKNEVNFINMNLDREIWKQISKLLHRFPNDMELGSYIRRESLMNERRHKRNLKTHIDNDNN